MQATPLPATATAVLVVCSVVVVVVVVVTVVIFDRTAACPRDATRDGWTIRPPPATAPTGAVVKFANKAASSAPRPLPALEVAVAAAPPAEETRALGAEERARLEEDPLPLRLFKLLLLLFMVASMVPLMVAAPLLLSVAAPSMAAEE